MVKVGDLCPSLADDEKFETGQCFIHRELAYRGVVLKSFPCTVSLNEQHDRCSYLHLVVADTFDIKALHDNVKLGDFKHKLLGGNLSDVDIVETSEMVPYKNNSSPVFNETLGKYFDRIHADKICLVSEDTSRQFNYVFRLQAMKYMQHFEKQTLQVMLKSYKKLEHMYDINSSITCFKMIENTTGSSNWLVSVRLNEAPTALITNAKIDVIVVQEKIRMKTAEFPEPNGSVLHFNHFVKLRDQEKAAFVFGIITYRKQGWPKEYRLRTNVSVMLPTKAMQMFKGANKDE